MLKTIKIKPGGNNKGTITLDFYSCNKKSRDVVIFVGGSGDTRHTWTKVIRNLFKHSSKYNYVSFSFSGRENHKDFPVNQQIIDLASIIEHVVSNLGFNKITIIATSMGAFSTCWFMTCSKLSSYINKIIFLDPGDYYLVPTIYTPQNKVNTWDGSSRFKPDAPLCSDLLVGLPSNVKVDVVQFTLRNRNKTGYISKDHKDRGIDSPHGYPRLNTKMVKGFYSKTPLKNRGVYAEQNNLPHAFARDGDIKANQKLMAELIYKLL